MTCSRCLREVEEFYRGRVCRPCWYEYGKNPAPKVPAAPFKRFIEAQGGISAVAEQLGGEHRWERALYRLQASENLTLDFADKLACALGFHLSKFDPFYDEQVPA